MKYTVVETKIENIRAGDTIIHNGNIVTVCRKNIGYDALLGKTLFGDSYRAGTILVKLVNIIRAIPGRML